MWNPATTLSAAASFLLAGLAGASDEPSRAQPLELGAVSWQRDLEGSLGASQSLDQIVLVFFVRIGDGRKLVEFGEQVLSNPLLVEAMETEFLPVAIYETGPGEHERVRHRYSEAAADGPVLRFLDSQGSDILPRGKAVWTVHEVADRLVSALEAKSRPIPGYLEILAEETDPAPLERTTLAVEDQHRAEGELGALPGVVEARSGWLGGYKIVEIAFRPAELTFKDLLQQALDLDCAHLVYCHSADQLQAARELMGDRAHKSPGRAREMQVSERRFYLKKTPLRLLPLTPMQSMRVNSALARSEDPVPWLSARQWQLAQELTQTLQEDPDAVAGLTPPDSLDRLASYDRRLRRRLDQISSQTTAQ